MRRVVAMFVVVSAVVLTCAPFALAQAQSFTDRQVIPVPGAGVINPCTGEEVIFDGTLRFVVHVTQNEGGAAIFVSNATFHGQGVSSSGAKYVVNQFGNTVSNAHISDEASSPT